MKHIGNYAIGMLYTWQIEGHSITLWQIDWDFGRMIWNRKQETNLREVFFSDEGHPFSHYNIAGRTRLDGILAGRIFRSAAIHDFFLVS